MQEIFVKSALDNWYTQIKRTDTLIQSLTDEQLQQQVAPGRNRGVYLVGHLAAVHDAMLPLLNFGDRLYAQLDEAFLRNPDNPAAAMPTVQELRTAWKTVHEKLGEHFNTLPAADWAKKHNSVSEEDFAKEPHRNRLNVLLNRTNHLAYHFGQLAFLKNDRGEA